MAIFLSYARADSAAVQALTKDLERTEHRPWMDGQLRGGDAWWNEILRQIRECEVFIFALSDQSMHSKPCQAELDYARRLGVPMIPLQVGPVSTMRAGPFADIQVIDYRNANSTAAMELFSTIQRLTRDRGPLPHPDAEPPGVPFAYLMRLRNEIDSPTLSAEDQERIVLDLTRAFEQEESSVRPDIVELMRGLKGRPDVTWRVANQLDRILAPVGAPAGGGGAPGGSPPGPRPAPPPGGGSGWTGPPPGGGPGTTVPPQRGAAPPMGPSGPRIPTPPVGQPPPTAPRGGGHRTAWILAAVGAVVLVLVVVAVVVAQSSGGGDSATIGIKAHLDTSTATSVGVAVTIQGQDVGRLAMDESSTDASLSATVSTGSDSYELGVAFVNDDGSQVTCSGQGTIDVSDGASFAVVTQDSDSGCTASLEPQ